MASVFLTHELIANMALDSLVNQLQLLRLTGGRYDDQFAKKGAKGGNEFFIRKPPKYVTTSGPLYTGQDNVEERVLITLQHHHVGLGEIDAQQMVLDIDFFMERFINPAMLPLANLIDQEGLKLAEEFTAIVGMPGSSLDDLGIIGKAKVALDDAGAPFRGTMARSIVLNSTSEDQLITANEALFNASQEIDRQYIEGSMGRARGFRFYMDQNVAAHVAGLFTTGSTPLMAATPLDGATTISTDGWVTSTTNVLRKGDHFTLPGLAGARIVNRVNVQSLADSGNLKTFVVTADLSTDGTAGGPLTIPFSPPLQLAGARQTVTVLPADGDPIAPFGTELISSPLNIGFHPNALAFASVDFDLPGGLHKAIRLTDDQTGIRMMYTSGFDISKFEYINRIDVLFGWALQYEELGVIIGGG